MGNPVVRGGRYVDPLPSVIIPLTSGGRRNVQPNRTLVVSFGVGGILLRGHVDLYGPIRDDNVPDSQQYMVHARDETNSPAREIIRVMSGQMATDRPTAAVFRRAASQFPTGFYEMTVTITAPDSLKPPTASGGAAGNLVYSRVVWVQFDIIEQTRALPGEGGTPAATPGSARPQDIGLTHKGVVIGDPVTLELAYLFQFGREFPGIVSAVNYRLPTSGQLSSGGGAGPIGFPAASGGGQGFGQQFALYHGTVKKVHGNIGLARNIYRMVQEIREGVRSRRLARSVPDPEQMLPPPTPGTRPSVDHRFSQAWLDEFATMANARPRDIRMAMNHVMYEELFESASQDRELLTRLFPEGQPPSRLGQGVQALEYMGKILDVFDMGINAINYGEHCRRSLAARNALLGALRAMYHDKAFSLLRLMEIENFRHTWVRRGAQAIEMLRSVPTALLGWIPVGGWVIAIAGFLAGQMENLTRGAVTDWLEDSFNAWMVDPNFQRELETQTYQRAFGGSDETHTAQRMLIQLTIRSKLLYDLKELVEAINPGGVSVSCTLLYTPHDVRIRMARALVSRIVTKDPWYIHKDLVFSDRETYMNPDGVRDIMGTPQRDWIPVEFQEFFPIDCYGGDVQVFARRFHEGHDLKLEVEIQGADLDRFEIRFGHFRELGFVNRVWAFVYAIRPPTLAQMGEDFSGREQDTRRRPDRVWSEDLRNTLRQISEDLEQAGTFEANLRPHALWVYRREEGESEQGPDGPVPHLTRDGDDFVALCYPRPSGLTNHFDFNRHAYLFLLATNIRDQIVFSKLQYYVGGSRSTYPLGASRYDVQGSFLVRENQRIRFQ